MPRRIELMSEEFYEDDHYYSDISEIDNSEFLDWEDPSASDTEDGFR